MRWISCLSLADLDQTQNPPRYTSVSLIPQVLPFGHARSPLLETVVFQSDKQHSPLFGESHRGPAEMKENPSYSMLKKGRCWEEPTQGFNQWYCLLHYLHSVSTNGIVTYLPTQCFHHWYCHLLYLHSVSTNGTAFYFTYSISTN